MRWLKRIRILSLQWRHNGCDGVSNHQPHNCLLNRLFRHRSKKTSKLCVTGLCVGNSPVIGEFPAQMASNAENVSIDGVIMDWHIRTTRVGIFAYIYTHTYRVQPTIQSNINISPLYPWNHEIKGTTRRPEYRDILLLIKSVVIVGRIIMTW